MDYQLDKWKRRAMIAGISLLGPLVLIGIAYGVVAIPAMAWIYIVTVLAALTGLAANYYALYHAWYNSRFGSSNALLIFLGSALAASPFILPLLLGIG